MTASSRLGGRTRQQLRDDIFTDKHKTENELEVAQSYELSQPTTRDVVYPLARLYHLTKQHHQVGTKCSNTRA